LFGAPEAEAPTWAHAQSPAQIMAFAELTVFFLSIGSTAIYSYTPELHPTEIRTTAMGIASACEGSPISDLAARSFLVTAPTST